MCKLYFQRCPPEDSPVLEKAFKDISLDGPGAARFFASRAPSFFSEEWPNRLLSLTDALANQAEPMKNLVLAISPFEIQTANFVFDQTSFAEKIERFIGFHHDGIKRLMDRTKEEEVLSVCLRDAMQTRDILRGIRPHVAERIDASFAPIAAIAATYHL